MRKHERIPDGDSKQIVLHEATTAESEEGEKPQFKAGKVERARTAKDEEVVREESVDHSQHVRKEPKSDRKRLQIT